MRLVAVRERQRRRTVAGDQALESLLARELEKHRREHRVVLDDEHDVIAGGDGVPVVGGGRQRHRHRGGSAHDRAVAFRGVGGAERRRARRRRLDRQEQREGRAPARLARDDDLAAEKPRDLAADGEAEARAAVLAARRAVGLLEGLEDDALLVLGDADAGVA